MHLLTSRRPRIGPTALALFCVALFSGCALRAPAPVSAPPTPAPTPTPARQAFEATAYSIKGKTASGTHTRPGVVAADPNVLPLGSRIRVYGADAYSGEYTVTDTGGSIKGREIDIFIPDVEEARRFGRRQVDVEILQSGP